MREKERNILKVKGDLKFLNILSEVKNLNMKVAGGIFVHNHVPFPKRVTLLGPDLFWEFNS